MPANLTPDYLAVEKRYREAKDPAEKLEFLREMLRVIPKHKGTEKLQAGLKQRIAKSQAQLQQAKKSGHGDALDHVDKEGVGQVALVGLPNCGKSSILAAVTKARPEVAEYPFTTFRSLPGMMAFEDIQIQLVDLPPISSEYTEPWVFGIIRTADLVALVVDASQPGPEDAAREAMAILEEHHLRLARRGEKPEPDVRVAAKRAVILAAKCDLDSSAAGIDQLRGVYGSDYAVVPVSVATGRHVDEMRRALFEGLRLVRVYTRQPHRRRTDLGEPFVLPRGSTVADVARAVHKDVLGTMKFARIWGSERFEGQAVQRDHQVEDRDIIEIHL